MCYHFISLEVVIACKTVFLFVVGVEAIMYWFKDRKGDNYLETKYWLLREALTRKKRERGILTLEENRVELTFYFEIFKDRYLSVSVRSRGEANGGGLKYPTDRIIDGAMLYRRKVTNIGGGFSFRKKMSMSSFGEAKNKSKEKFKENTYFRPEGVWFRSSSPIFIFPKNDFWWELEEGERIADG